MDRRYLIPLAVAVLVARLGVLTSDWTADTGAYMLVARLWADGQLPYVDVWDNKAPVIYWLGRIYLATGAPRLAMYFGDVALTVAGCVAAATLLRRFGAQRQVASAVGSLAFVGSLPFHHCHNTEIYACPLFMIGFCLAIPGAGPDSPRRRWLTAILAGVCLAAAVALRAPLAASPLLVMVLAGYCAVRAGRPLLPAVAGIAIGGGLLTAWILGHALWHHYFREMLEDVVFENIDYAIGSHRSTTTLTRVLGVFLARLDVGLVASLCAGIGAVLGLQRLRATVSLSPGVALWFAALALFGLDVAATFYGGHQSAHYFYHLGWSGTLLLGAGLIVGLPALAAREALPLLGPALAVWLLTVLTSEPSRTGIRSIAVNDPVSSSRRLEAAAREVIPPHESVLLLDEYAWIGAMARLPHPVGTKHAFASMYDLRAASDHGSMVYVALAERLLSELDGLHPQWLLRVEGCSNRLDPWIQRNYDLKHATPEFVTLSGPRRVLFYRRKGN